jgi:hypothetical protein
MKIPKKPSARKSSPFYWWRRFPTPSYPKTKQIRDRIKNGEFDSSPYVQQVEWEKEWMKQEIEEETQHYQNISSIVFYDEVVRPVSKIYNKRIKHLTEDSWKDEDKRLHLFVRALKKEFMLSEDVVFDFLSNFEGTIQECYNALDEFCENHSPHRLKKKHINSTRIHLMNYVKNINI